MPNLDGYQTTRVIRRRESEGKRVPMSRLGRHVVGARQPPQLRRASPEEGAEEHPDAQGAAVARKAFIGEHDASA